MSEDKVVIPSNEEVLDVEKTDDEIVVTDEGNKESVETLDDSEHIKFE